MTPFPIHYRRFTQLILRFSSVMMIVALLLGITYQESSKKAPVSELLPAGAHWEAISDLALSHGHTFLIGALIPLALVWMLFLGLQLGCKPVSEKTLKVGSSLYLPGAVGAIVLMIYKGYHYVLGVRGGQYDFRILHETYFAGNHALRASAYGLTHTAMALGLIIIVVSLWKTYKTAPVSAE